MTTPVDLRELRIERSPTRPRSPRRRFVIARFFVPLIILSGFGGVLLWSVGHAIWPAKGVTVVSVIARRSDFVAMDTPLFQAAGWIEPRPQPVYVSALTEGIVEEILVVEGEAVEAGQTVARLIRRDAEITLQRTEADIRLREAEVIAAQAAVTAANALFEEPIPLLAALADADAALAKVETELARLPFLIRAAEARHAFSEKEVAGKAQSIDAVAAITMSRAQSDLESSSAQLGEYRQQSKSFERERLALARRRDVLNRRLELKVEESQQVAESQAKLQMAEAQLGQAEAVRDSARLNLDRTEVRAKTGGHVLTLVAKPGSRLMGVERAATYDASTVLTMFDPRSLQVRADVRLEDVPRVLVGQAVRIETPACPEPMIGHVLMATALTDIQKNTLQVKITIDNPPAVLKPDMLVQVTFLAPARPASTGNSPPLTLLVPRQLIQGSGDEARVWLADQTTSTARLRRVTLGSTTNDGLTEICTGLNVGDRVIVGGREVLVDGERIRISGRDAVLGHDAATAASENAGIKSSHIQRSGSTNTEEP